MEEVAGAGFSWSLCTHTSSHACVSVCAVATCSDRQVQGPVPLMGPASNKGPHYSVGIVPWKEQRHMNLLTPPPNTPVYTCYLT